MSEQFTIGQSLTPEQVRNLPDGSEVEIYGSKTNAPFKIKSVLRDYEHKAYIANELEYFGLCCDLVSLPPAPSEPSRRIEPQAEPAKPERQTSEIEKRAAMALVELFKNTIEECVMTRRLESLRGRCTEYIEAYDYAKSIGAIE